MKSTQVLLLLLCLAGWNIGIFGQKLPMVISTWDHSWNATVKAWDLLQGGQTDIMDVLVQGISVCELTYKACGGSVGYGNKPDENGEVTLDAMVMDGRIMKVGSVGCLRRVKNAVAVARAVLDHTTHTLLVGDLATEFAKTMGFPEESLSSLDSDQEYQTWLTDSCQPNFWQNVVPDPTTSCGPYAPSSASAVSGRRPESDVTPASGEPDHDTIGTIVIDGAGNVVSGTSTNGLTHKIAGRVGDSPIAGAGAYAETGIGAAVSTGNGDIMMRFSPAFYAVDLMSRGSTPFQAVQTAIQKIVSYYPQFNGAMIAVNVAGDYGVACHGYAGFEVTLANPTTGQVIQENIVC